MASKCVRFGLLLSLSLLCGAASAHATPLTVGGFTFAQGELAFADDAFLVSGSSVRFGDCVPNPPNASSYAEALSGSDLTDCVNVDSGGDGIVEVLFTNNFIVNLSGADLAIFELSGPQTPGTADPRERFELSIFDGSVFTAFVGFDPVATGFGTPDPGLEVFAVQVDLSAFGLGPGASVDRLRLHLFDNGAGTKGADIAALGALHSIPEPGSLGLLSLALVAVLIARRG